MARGFASPRPSKGGGSLHVGVEVDARKATLEFKQARKDINKRTKIGLLKAAEREAKPAARLVAPGFARPYIAAGATTRNAYITTKGPRWVGRAMGLLEYGGTVETQILPLQAKALKVGPGIFRAAVNTPRTYRARGILTHAVIARRPQIEAAILDEVMNAYDGLPHTP
jgi:hypothetical protein